MKGKYGKRETGSYFGCSRGGSKSRNKAEWAGVGPGDAFKPEIDYHLRLPAQRMFYKATREIQEEAARHAGIIDGKGFEPKVLPQIGACYTGYPASLAALAAMGLTAYLEFGSRVSGNVFAPDIVQTTRESLLPNQDDAISPVVEKLILFVSECVQKRLFLADLSSNSALGSIEVYRIFSAAHQSMSFETLADMVSGVVLFGDILPPWGTMKLHPLTRTILENLSEASRPYFEKLGSCPAEQHHALGKDWIIALYGSLLRFVPPELLLPPTNENPKGEVTSKLRDSSSHHVTRSDGNAGIPPFAAPCHPSLFKRRSFGENLIEDFTNNLSEQDKKLEAVKTSIGIRSGLEALRETLNAFEDVLSRAGKQKNDWEDMRSDVLIRILMKSPFMEDPIQGDPVCGHHMEVSLGDEQTFSGEVFDRPIGLSEDAAMCEKLMMDARASTQAMRDIIYPNREMCPVIEKIRTRGSIDPARLALSAFSQAVFKVNRLQEKLDKRGSPVIAIACDGSGSLGPNQMRMLKILATSWINSTAGTDIRVLAGLYTSGQIRNGVCGPVVNWIYHPHKTPATSRNDAARAVAALPESGNGAQADALSLAFIMEEAKKLAKGKMIYLILLTDCAWNKSFKSEKTGYDEVRSLFETLYADLQEKLHVTMVGLAVSERTGMEDLLDKVIAISKAELIDSRAIAGKIGLYVASCVRERNNG